MLRIYKPLRLHHIYVLFLVSIQEGGFDIHLPNLIVKVCGYGENNPYRSNVCNKRKGFPKKYALGLGITFCYKTSFKCMYIAIYISLYLEKPFAPNGSTIKMKINQTSHLVIFHGLHFYIQSLNPFIKFRIWQCKILI